MLYCSHASVKINYRSGISGEHNIRFFKLERYSLRMTQAQNVIRTKGEWFSTGYSDANATGPGVQLIDTYRQLLRPSNSMFDHAGLVWPVYDIGSAPSIVSIEITPTHAPK